MYYPEVLSISENCGIGKMPKENRGLRKTMCLWVGEWIENSPVKFHRMLNSTLEVGRKSPLEPYRGSKKHRREKTKRRFIAPSN